jgi:hypothetical protein
MSKLTSKGRSRLPDSDFALPGRRYPIETRSHAIDALARVDEDGTPEEQAEVRRRVHERYPDIDIEAMDKSRERRRSGRI